MVRIETYVHKSRANYIQVNSVNAGHMGNLEVWIREERKQLEYISFTRKRDRRLGKPETRVTPPSSTIRVARSKFFPNKKFNLDMNYFMSWKYIFLSVCLELIDWGGGELDNYLHRHLIVRYCINSYRRC